MLFISAVVSGSNRTVYHTDCGCQVGGELAFSISGTENPEFVKDIDVWKASALSIASEMKRFYRQFTVS